MVKHFKDAGKEAIGINDILYPTDRLFIDKYDLKVLKMDMHNITIENEMFDAVWCRHTLEHSFAPMRVISEMWRVTKKGGYLFLALPPPPNPEKPYEGHYHQIPDYQARYLLNMSNYRVLNMWNAYFSYKAKNDNLEIRAICRKMGVDT